MMTNEIHAFSEIIVIVTKLFLKMYVLVCKTHVVNNEILMQQFLGMLPLFISLNVSQMSKNVHCSFYSNINLTQKSLGHNVS